MQQTIDQSGKKPLVSQPKLTKSMSHTQIIQKGSLDGSLTYINLDRAGPK